jgi:MoaA/NifB/PqqE/SkfB family radical SAM enzyme
MKSEQIKEWFIKNAKLYFTSIELTQNCNFACKHCYCTDKQSQNLSLKEYISIIDKLHDTGCLYLNLTGGEILTNKNFKEIYVYAKNKGFVIDLLTNGSLIDDQIIEVFKELPPNSIAITIYGVNRIDYQNFTGNGDNFDKTIAGLEKLKENSIPFVLRTVATKTLRDSLFRGEFELLAKRYETTFKYDVIVFPKTSGDTSPLGECMGIDDIIKLESMSTTRKEAWEMEIQNNAGFTWSCQGGLNSMTIDHRGNAFICGLYRNNPISILENDINDVLDHLRGIHERHIHIVKNNTCSACDKRAICKWCPAYSTIYNNNEFDRIDFFCDLAEARVNTFG